MEHLTKQRNQNVTKSASKELLRINVGRRDLSYWQQEAWQAIAAKNDPPFLFWRSGELVEIIRDRVSPVGVDRLRSILAEVAAWGRSRNYTWVSDLPPDAVVSAILADPLPHLPPLQAVASAPVVAKGDRLLLDIGYDEASGVYHLPNPRIDGLDVPTDPTAEQVTEARRLLVDEFLGSFQFASPGDLARAAAAFFTIFVRPSLPTAPLFFVTAPVAGSGKTRLVESLSLAATAARPSLVGFADDDNERRKAITAALRDEPSVLCFDNVRGLISSEAVERALTFGVWRDRLLGSNREVAISVASTWFLTANNGRLGEDLRRRAVTVSLDPRVEHPERRPLSAFRHEMPTWAETHVADVLSAGLVVIRAWQAKGMPQGGASVGSFETWSQTVDGILSLIGLDGHLDEQSAASEALDPSEAAWSSFVGQWWEKEGAEAVSTADLFPIADSIDDLSLRGRDDKGRKASLGRLLHLRRNRVIAGRRIVSLGTDRTGVNLWRLEAALEEGEL